MNRGYKAVYLLFCAGIAFLVWTLAYGVVLGVVYKDSRILNITITENPLLRFSKSGLTRPTQLCNELPSVPCYLPSPPPYLQAISVLDALRTP